RPFRRDTWPSFSRPSPTPSPQTPRRACRFAWSKKAFKPPPTPAAAAMARICEACRSAASRDSITQGPAINASGAPPPIVTGPIRTAPDTSAPLPSPPHRQGTGGQGPGGQAISAARRAARGQGAEGGGGRRRGGEAGPWAARAHEHDRGRGPLALHHLEPAQERRLAAAEPVLQRRPDKPPEERMTVHGSGAELGMELARHEPGMAILGQLDQLDQRSVGRKPGQAEPTRGAL